MISPPPSSRFGWSDRASRAWTSECILNAL